EGALGPGAVGPLGEGEPGPQAVVAAGVVEGALDPDQLLAGAQLEGGDHLDEALAHAGAVLDALGPCERAGDPEPGSHRSSLHDVHTHCLGTVDGAVSGRGGPVVSVAVVTVVDQAVEPGQPVERERAVGGVDLDPDQPVVEPTVARVHRGCRHGARAPGP